MMYGEMPHSMRWKAGCFKGLYVLLQQPEVNSTKKITVIGHSEGTMIAPRIAIDNPDKVGT